MTSIKKAVVALGIAALGLLPVSAAQAVEARAQAAPRAAHCFPFIDHPLVCFVKCVAQTQSPKGCGVGDSIALDCDQLSHRVCDVIVAVWDLVP